MLTKLYEELLRNTELTSVTAAEIKDTDELVLHIFNDDASNNKRLQFIENSVPKIPPGLTEADFQNPTAHIADYPSTDGLYACLSNSPKGIITCAGGTPSAYVNFTEGDVFDFSIGNVSYINKTYDEMVDIFAASDIELVAMMQNVPWHVQYTLISTGEVVKLNTGPNVSKSTIDPTVDFNDTESPSYVQWLDDVADRKDLIINTNVTSIESSTFNDWVNVTNITLLGGGDIGDEAFASLRNIDTFIIGAKVRSMGASAMAGMSILNLTIEEGITTFGDTAMAGMGNLTTLILPNSVTTLGNQVCAGWQTPRKLVVGSGIKVLRGDEFSAWGFQGANDLTFSEGIEQIGTTTDNAFMLWKCTSLTLPNSLTYVGKGCFADWNEAISLNIGSGKLVIDAYAFQAWSNATSLSLGGTESIGANAFLNWTNYVNPLTVPGSVKDIYGGAFLNWESCKGLTIEEGVVSIGTMLNDDSSFDGMQSFTNWYKAEFLHIANSVKSTHGSFVNWFMCNDLHIGSGLTTIGGTEYGESEFTNMGRDITGFDVTFPDTVINIIDALGGSAVRSITIGNNVQTIGNLPYSAEKFYIRSATPPAILSNNMLPNATPAITVYVPNVSVYQNNTDWANKYDIQTSADRFTLFEQWNPV